MAHSLRDMSRFVWIEGLRFTFTDCAKPTVASADITAQHEGCSTVSPALEDVWTPCLLTDRVQVQTLNQLKQMILIRRIAQANPEPLRFWLTRLNVQNLKFAGHVYFDLSAKTF